MSPSTSSSTSSDAPPSEVAYASVAVKGMRQVARVKGPPPVHLWNPPFCGDIDMRIAADGTWFYLKTPIGRKPLVKLFASVLRRDDDDKHYLVTPAEKVGIVVDDAPFVVVEVRRDSEQDALRVRTNVDDEFLLDDEHPLRVEIDPRQGGFKPYARVRARLDALFTRSATLDLIELGEFRESDDGRRALGVSSAGRFRVLAEGDALHDVAS